MALCIGEVWTLSLLNEACTPLVMIHPYLTGSDQDVFISIPFSPTTTQDSGRHCHLWGGVISGYTAVGINLAGLVQGRL